MRRHGFFTSCMIKDLYIDWTPNTLERKFAKYEKILKNLSEFSHRFTYRQSPFLYI